MRSLCSRPFSCFILLKGFSLIKYSWQIIAINVGLNEGVEEIWQAYVIDIVTNFWYLSIISGQFCFYIYNIFTYTGYWNLNKLKHFALTCIKVCQIKDLEYLLDLYCSLWIEQYLEIYSVLVEGLRKWIANTKLHIDFTHQSPVIL